MNILTFIFLKKCIKYHFIIIREMLIDVLRELINNLFKESFYMKKKKKTINILTVFSFLKKVMSKFF